MAHPTRFLTIVLAALAVSVAAVAPAHAKTYSDPEDQRSEYKEGSYPDIASASASRKGKTLTHTIGFHDVLTEETAAHAVAITLKAGGGTYQLVGDQISRWDDPSFKPVKVRVSRGGERAISFVFSSKVFGKATEYQWIACVTWEGDCLGGPSDAAPTVPATEKLPKPKKPKSKAKRKR